MSLPTALATLAEVKEHLGVPVGNTASDAALTREIEAVQSIVEEITGPMVPTGYDEWYDGGNDIITLDHVPSYGYGTKPLLELIAVSEYRGPIEYPLGIIPTPMAGTTYSVMLNGREGTITRRTAGGGTLAFGAMRDSIHVVYRSGQSVIPPNVRSATCELIRVNFRTTEMSGTGAETVADAEESGPRLGFFVPNGVRERLSPNQRAPSVA